jgi:hypothetical protein
MRPPTYISPYGVEFWEDDEGRMHNVEGPAIVYPDGRTSWWIHGKRHRLDGPAMEWAVSLDPDASYTDEWHINGVELSEEEFNRHPEVIAYRKAKEMLKTLDVCPETKRNIEDLWQNL